MKITIEGDVVRFHGNRNVDLQVFATSGKEMDRFSLSLCFDGMEHGVLPSIEVAGGHIVVYNNGLERGKQLLK